MYEISPHAQTNPATLPDLQLSVNGTVLAMALQNDGKVIIGGDFTLVNGVVRRSLARINLNGSVDSTWSPTVAGFSQIVYAIVVSGPDVFVGGEDNLAKLSIATGEVDRLWAPNLRVGQIYCLGVQDTNLFVGGQYLYISGSQSPRSVAKLSPVGTGQVEADWNPDLFSHGGVKALAVNGTNVYIGGKFSINAGGTTIINLARVSTGGKGLADPEWNPNLSSPNADSSILAVAVNDSGSYAGGDFQTVAGVTALSLARFDLVRGARDASFPAHAGRDGAVNAIVRLANGKLIVGGASQWREGLHAGIWFGSTLMAAWTRRGLPIPTKSSSLLP